LYNCAAPSVAALNLAGLQAGGYPNISLTFVLVTLSENGRVLATGKAGAVDGTDATSVAYRARLAPGLLGALYEFVDGDSSPALQEYAAARAQVPPLSPWVSCFVCSPTFAVPTLAPGAPSTLGLRFTSTGVGYCFTSSTPATIQNISMCVSPLVGSSDPSHTTNSSILSVFSNAAAATGYPIATRASVARIYCVFSLPPVYVANFNASTNVTTWELQPPTYPPFWSPVLARNTVQNFVVCAAPSLAHFGGAGGGVSNVSVTFAEYDLVLPLRAQTFLFVPESDPRLVDWRAQQAEAGAEQRCSARCPSARGVTTPPR
jgi:hypothetical protein